MEVAKCSLPPDDSGTQAKEGMKEREGGGQEEKRTGGWRQTRESKVPNKKRARPLLASVAEALLDFQFRIEARAQWSMR